MRPNVQAGSAQELGDRRHSVKVADGLNGRQARWPASVVRVLKGLSVS